MWELIQPEAGYRARIRVDRLYKSMVDDRHNWGFDNVSKQVTRIMFTALVTGQRTDWVSHISGLNEEIVLPVSERFYHNQIWSSSVTGAGRKDFFDYPFLDAESYLDFCMSFMLIVMCGSGRVERMWKDDEWYYHAIKETER